MDNFLNKHNATHSDVIVFANKLTAEMHNAVFTINNDYKIRKVKTDTDAFSFDVTFSVDGMLRLTASYEENGYQNESETKKDYTSARIRTTSRTTKTTKH